MRGAKLSSIFAAFSMLFLGGCGLYVPDPHEFYEAKSNDTDFVNVVLNNIKCELHKEVQQDSAIDWLNSWGAKVDLKFTTDELGSFDPGATFKPPPPFSLGLGLDSSAHATRVEDLAVTYAFKDLLAEGTITNCANEGGILIQSDLKIGDFLFKHVYLTTIPGTLPQPVKKLQYDTLSYSLTFVAAYDASITPTWTFKHVTVNPSGKLLDLSRTRTSNLIITFAPTDTKAATATADAPARLNDQGLLAHDAAVIGQAVGTANQAVTH